MLARTRSRPLVNLKICIIITCEQVAAEGGRGRTATGMSAHAPRMRMRCCVSRTSASDRDRAALVIYIVL